MIRKLEKEDIPFCVKICEDNFNVEGFAYDVKSDFLFQFENNNINLEFYVFDDGVIKGVAGLSNCWFSYGVYGLCTCYVDINCQKQGIGKKLTEFRISRIKELGGDVVLSTTKKTWHLERFGFKKIESPVSEWKLMQLTIK